MQSIDMSESETPQTEMSEAVSTQMDQLGARTTGTVSEFSHINIGQKESDMELAEGSKSDHSFEQNPSHYEQCVNEQRVASNTEDMLVDNVSFSGDEEGKKKETLNMGAAETASETTQASKRADMDTMSSRSLTVSGLLQSLSNSYTSPAEKMSQETALTSSTFANSSSSNLSCEGGDDRASVSLSPSDVTQQTEKLKQPQAGENLDACSVMPTPASVAQSPAQISTTKEAVLVSNPQLVDTSGGNASDKIKQELCNIEAQTASDQIVFEASSDPVDQMDVQESGAEKLYSAVEASTTSKYQVVFDFSNRAVPKFVTSVRSEYSTAAQDNFLRGCKWSPDGSRVLTNSNDNVLRLFKMTEEVTDKFPVDREQRSEVLLKEGGTVYDFAWHPAMSAEGHGDNCWVATTCSGVPMHLWDSRRGKIVASYRAYDQYDEITAAFSLSFSPSGEKLFGGYNKAIRMFDTEYPGKTCKLIKTTKSKKKSLYEPSQSGIISSFAHSPTSPGVYAAGSYTRLIGVYDVRCDGGPTCVMEGQQGGITHMMFTPNGQYLFTGARKDNEIVCWDFRNPGTVCYAALRECYTNQRMYFDISRCGQYLTSGNDGGSVTVWNLQREAEYINEANYLRPIGQFQAHKDCVNGVSFHPNSHLLASASGQRHFQNFDTSDTSDSESESNSTLSGRDRSKPLDFSLKIWRMPLAVS